MPAKWRSRSDAGQLEFNARRAAERLGLSPTHIMALLDLSALPSALIGVHDSAAAEIDRQLRTIALDRPDLMRPGAPLPASSREVYEHWQGLHSAGRTREADAFGKRHADAIAQARPVVAREMQQAHDEAARREWLAGRRMDALRKARHEVAEEQSYLDHVTRGEWPRYITKDRSEVPTARDVMDSRVRLASKQADLAQLEAEGAAASAAS